MALRLSLVYKGPCPCRLVLPVFCHLFCQVWGSGRGAPMGRVAFRLFAAPQGQRLALSSYLDTIHINACEQGLCPRLPYMSFGGGQEGLIHIHCLFVRLHTTISWDVAVGGSPLFFPHPFPLGPGGNAKSGKPTAD